MVTIGRSFGHGQRGARGVVGHPDVIHVDRVELPVAERHLHFQRPALVRRHREFIVHDLAGARRDLVIVQRRENVLRIAAVNPLAVPVEHVDIDEMSPGIDLAVRPKPPLRPMTRPSLTRRTSAQASFESTVPWV